MSLVNTGASKTGEFDQSKLGRIEISLTNRDNTSEPEIASGSVIEVAGTTYYASANDDIDPDGNWGGIANSTLVYLKFTVDSTGVKSVVTTTKPTWDTAKQGFYATNDRYYGYIYKNSNGDYTRKYCYGNISDGGHDLNSVGDIAWCCTQYKPGYVIADGSTISSTTNPEYGRLVHLLKMEALADAAHPFYHADADKAVLPDLNGRSLRAIDVAGTRDQDGTRDAGEYQADENKEHNHELEILTIAGASLSVTVSATGNAAGNAALIRNDGNTENTVKNITMWGLIKY